MPLPTVDDLLDNLYRMRRECVAEIAAAEAREDLKQARSFQKTLAGINNLILEKGGDNDA